MCQILNGLLMNENHPIQVVHIITRMILGGAQENTALTMEGLAAQADTYHAILLTGPTVGPEGELMHRLDSNKIEWQLVPRLQREIAPVADFICLLQLIRLLKKLRPHIVHTHSSKAGILGRLAAWLCGVPVVIHTIHGLPFHPYEKVWLNWIYIVLEKWCAKITQRIITVADAMKLQAIAAGVANEQKFVTIYSGMEVNIFLAHTDVRHLRQQLGLTMEHIVLGVISRLAPLKGHNYLINIAAEVVARYPNARFLFVGDGRLREELQQAVAQKKLQDFFIFAGLVPQDSIPGYIQAMDYCIHPSLREGLAKVLPQAILCNRPVISFDIDGAREVVLPERTGYLVAPGDEQALLTAILRLLQERGLPNPLSQSERAEFIEQFDANHMVRQIANVYQNCLQAPECRASLSRKPN